MTCPSPPALADPTRLSLFCSFIGIATATVLLIVLAGRILMHIDVWHWSVPILAIAGIATADFLSGLVHWAADSWGRDDLPVIGRTILVPFRVHHVNPDDFLRRRFLDTNGHVAFVTLPVLLTLFTVPIDTPPGAVVALFGYPLCAIGMMTNQIHQWAHMTSPPPLVRVLQNYRLLLGRDQHAAHHRAPYARHYCITTGWCNGVLEATGFFRHLERAVVRATGIHPRLDDARYEVRFAATSRDGAA